MTELTAQDFRLHNGINVFVFPTAKFKTTTVRLYLHHPLSAETVTRTALYPNVLRRGTRRLPSTRELARELESLYGTRAGTEVNKRGDDQLVTFNLEFIDDEFVPGGGKLLSQALRLLRELVTDPVRDGDGFRPDYVDKEREALRREIEGLINDKGAYAAFRCIEETLGDDPYALLSDGRVADLAEITPEGLLAYYQRALRTAPADLYVVGDVHPDAIHRLLDDVFDFPRQGEQERPHTRLATGNGRARRVVERQPVTQAKLVLTAVTGTSNRDPMIHALSVYNGVLGGYPHSKLFRNVREAASLAYYASSGVERTKGLLQVQSGIDVDKFEPALDIIEAQFRSILHGDISDEELEFTQRAICSRLAMAGDTAGQIIAQHFDGLLGGQSLTPTQEIAAIQGVTRDDIVAVAERIKLETIYLLTGEEAAH